MRQAEMERADEPPVQQETSPETPDHVPWARNGRGLVSDRSHRVAAKRYTLLSDADCRTMDCSAVAIPTPLLSSKPREPTQTRKIGKESVHSPAEKAPSRAHRSRRMPGRPALPPASTREGKSALFPQNAGMGRADSPNRETPETA